MGTFVGNSRETSMKPLISIIIPCYNQSHYLIDSVNSIVAQTYTHWECILVNDGSTDNTYAVANDLSKRDSRIHVIHQRNKGLSGARNRGLDEAQGQFVQFLDADDVIYPEKLKIQITSLLAINNRVALAYSDYRNCPENNIHETIIHSSNPPARFVMELPVYDMAARWETKMSIPVHCFLFNNYFFKELNIRFDENLPNHEDWDCWMQILKHNPTVVVTPEVLAVYRLTTNSMCSNIPGMWCGFQKAILKQQSLFKRNQLIQRILHKKLLEMKQVYLKSQWRYVVKRYDKEYILY